MPDWIYLLAIFIALTIGYGVGFYAGSWKSEAAPSDNAYINVRRYSIDAQKEVNLRSIETEHEEQMAMIDRGCFDGIEFVEGEPEEDEDDGED